MWNIFKRQSHLKLFIFISECTWEKSAPFLKIYLDFFLEQNSKLIFLDQEVPYTLWEDTLKYPFSEDFLYNRILFAIDML